MASTKTTSVKQAFTSPVIAITFLTILISVILTTYLDIRRQKEELLAKLDTFAEVIAFNAATSIVFDDPETEHNRLKSFIAADFIDNIHIYSFDSNINRTLKFFTSYNRSGVPPIPVKSDNLTELTKPQFSQYHIEMTRVINLEDNVIGYIYLRANLKKLDQAVKEKILINAVIGICVLIAALLMALKLQQKISTPIEDFVSIVQQITRNKDYSLRPKHMQIQELNILARAFDRMLDRVQQHINKQEQAEQQTRQLNQQLEEKVSERTIALKESNQELLATLEKMHQYQNHLVETEKMASLGQMVAGIAHEVNTPIGLGVTASTLLQDRMTIIQQAFKDKKLSANQLEKFLKEGEENLSIIYRNLNRAAKLISSFKQVAVDQSNDEIRTFNVNKLINEVLLSLQPNLKNTAHHIHIECNENLKIESKPGPLNQILINLIMNSLIHGFENIEEGTVTIRTQMTQGHCHISYQDNGVGVSDEIKEKIFDPFVTTKRGEGGSGLGMHLVYNLVTQALGGSISIDSETYQGIEFNIIFPAQVVNNGNEFVI